MHLPDKNEASSKTKLFGISNANTLELVIIFLGIIDGNYDLKIHIKNKTTTNKS